MLKFGNKEFRNLQEQVFKNMSDIAQITEGTMVLDEFGIKVVGEVDTLADLPTVAEYKADHEDWAYGDAYAVGTEAPYALYILTRANDTLDSDHWFDIGEFPMPGPQGETGPQGPIGPQGPQGNTGSAGTPAGFGSITATAQTLVPGSSATATVVASGTDAEKNFAFTFGIPAGQDGRDEWGEITGTLSDQTDLQAALDAKQDELEAGDNIKTINGQSILGSGDLHVSGTYDLTYGADSQTINILEVKAAIANGDILRVSKTTTDEYGYDTVVIYTLNNIKEGINYYDLYFNYATSTYDSIQVVGTISNQRVRMRYNKLLGTITWDTLTNVTISDDVVSQWGDITGTLSNQTDLQNALNAKQDTISDLSTIRSGAAAGATAVQPAQLATVATSGSYNDLSNKPTIGEGVLTIQKNGVAVDTFSANATAAKSINITVPTALSDLTNDVVNDATLTIQKNGTTVATFTANDSDDVTANIAVPTKTSDITNDSGFITKSVNDLTNYTLTNDLMDIAISSDYITGAPDLHAFVIDGDPYNLPAGPQGPAGATGATGPQGPQGPAGQDGTDGTDGTDGITPHIGDNGDWYIGETDTGVHAQGPAGQDGTNGTNGTNGTDGVGIASITKTSTSGLVDTYTITYTDSDTDTFTVTNGQNGTNGTNGTNGQDGVTPHIDSTTGDWFIGSTDTGVHAQGPQGEQGIQGIQGPQGPAGEGLTKITVSGLSGTLSAADLAKIVADPYACYIVDGDGKAYHIRDVDSSYIYYGKLPEVAVVSTNNNLSIEYVKITISSGAYTVSTSAYSNVLLNDVTVGGTSVVANSVAAIPAIPDAVSANPTVPSGTTPTSLTGLKIGNDYYDISSGGPSITITTTTGSESISDGTNTLNIVTRDTAQTISGIKTFTGEIDFTSDGKISHAADSTSGYHSFSLQNDTRTSNLSGLVIYTSDDGTTARISAFNNKSGGNGAKFDLGMTTSAFKDLYLQGAIKVVSNNAVSATLEPEMWVFTLDDDSVVTRTVMVG